MPCRTSPAANSDARSDRAGSWRGHGDAQSKEQLRRSVDRLPRNRKRTAALIHPDRGPHVHVGRGLDRVVHVAVKFAVTQREDIADDLINRHSFVARDGWIEAKSVFDDERNAIPVAVAFVTSQWRKSTVDFPL